jgi:SAM-dependent methyltransferase
MKDFLLKMAKKNLILSYFLQKRQQKKLMKIFKKDFELFNAQSKNDKQRFVLSWNEVWPFHYDKTVQTSYDTHYVYHTAWAARKVKEINPDLHVDISSSLYFCSIVSAFVPVNFYDYRPAPIVLSDLNSGAADLNNLPFEDNSIHSLSCMHTIEHIGLGRYGDKIDYNGDIKAIKELKRVMAIGGNLIFVVPIGRSRIQFNAHRIYSYNQILELFADLALVEYTLIPDNVIQDGPVPNASAELSDLQNYGCGCFWFIKK